MECNATVVGLKVRRGVRHDLHHAVRARRQGGDHDMDDEDEADDDAESSLLERSGSRPTVRRWRVDATVCDRPLASARARVRALALARSCALHRAALTSLTAAHTQHPPGGGGEGGDGVGGTDPGRPACDEPPNSKRVRRTTEP